MSKTIHKAVSDTGTEIELDLQLGDGSVSTTITKVKLNSVDVTLADETIPLTLPGGEYIGMGWLVQEKANNQYHLLFDEVHYAEGDMAYDFAATDCPYRALFPLFDIHIAAGGTLADAVINVYTYAPEAS